MQNRNMFLYRRQGPNKKRAKTGAPRKNRGPQKGLPNSARDLLPLIQPATKALAQMLAGRTGASGQLGHARAVLAQTERLVSERAHNRLNPAEREEFFEQVARLKLTLSDAESEAEVQAMEEDVAAPAAAPIDRERLKEMAMSLTSPGGATSYEDRHRGSAAQQAKAADQEPDETPDVPSSDETAEDETAEKVVASAPKPPDDPNQLRLPRAGAERIAIQPDAMRSRTTTRRRATKTSEAAPRKLSKAAAAVSSGSGQISAVRTADVEPAASDAPAAPGDDPKQKLPKGWIIDDEGFVVPGPAA